MIVFVEESVEAIASADAQTGECGAAPGDTPSSFRQRIPPFRNAALPPVRRTPEPISYPPQGEVIGALEFHVKYICS
jgi:hypothetical protein